MLNSGCECDWIRCFLALQAPLHLAVLDSKHEAVKMLLQCGASLVPLDESGQTPLSLARVIGNSTTATMLENEQGDNFHLSCLD